MITTYVRCYAELNDFLPAERRFLSTPVVLEDGARVDDLLAAVAIPLDSVDLILVSGTPSSPESPIASGTRIALYPVFESFDIRSLRTAHPAPLRTPRFSADVHVGKLAGHLRMCGFDTRRRTIESDAEFLEQAIEERRAILTRDRSLLLDPRVVRGYSVRSPDPREQLIEVLRRFDLTDDIHPFSRCIACNRPVETVPKREILPLLPERVRRDVEEFWRCPGCARVYWNGTHVDHMRRFIDDVCAGVRQEGSTGGGV